MNVWSVRKVCEQWDERVWQTGARKRDEHTCIKEDEMVRVIRQRCESAGMRGRNNIAYTHTYKHTHTYIIPVAFIHKPSQGDQ